MDDNSDTDAVFLSFEIIFALLSVRSESSNIGIEALRKCGSPKNMQLLKCPLEAPAVNQPTDAQVNVVTSTCLVSMANVLLHNSCTGIDFVLWLIFHHDVSIFYIQFISCRMNKRHTLLFSSQVCSCCKTSTNFVTFSFAALDLDLQLISPPICFALTR